GPVPKGHKKIKSTILFTEDLVALLPNNHFLANRVTIKLTELQNESFILFPEGYVLRNLFVRGCYERGFKYKVSFVGLVVYAISGHDSAGLDMSLVHNVTLVDSLTRETVKVRVTDPKLTRTVGVIVPTDRDLLPTEQVFLNFIKDYFNRLEMFQN